MKAQLAFESFLLGHGPRILAPLQRGISVSAGDPAVVVIVAVWFMRFVSALGEDWLRTVSLGTLEGFWRQLPDSRARQAAIDLITRVESANDPHANAAQGSLVVSLFREVHRRPLAQDLSEEGLLLLDSLFRRIRLTASSNLQKPQASVTRYTLRVLRYCFKPPDEKFSPQELDRVVALAGELNDEMRQRVYSELSV